MTRSTSISDDQLKKIYENISENDLFICSICSSICTNRSKHQLVSTQCGHLFGKNCIRKCLKDHHQCPFCQKNLSTRREQQLRPMCLSSVVTIFPSELLRMRQQRQILREQFQRIQTKFERTQNKFNRNQKILKKLRRRFVQRQKRHVKKLRKFCFSKRFHK